MTVVLGTASPTVVGHRHVRVAGWEIHLASAGNAAAVATPAASPGAASSVVLSEGAGVGLGDDGGSANMTHPRLELRFDASGAVLVRCQQAPPVLLVSSPSHAVQVPVTGAVGPVQVAGGSLLLALSPTVLDALAPAEILVAPRLLWMSPDPAGLLRRWVGTAIRRGLPGAAAAVARRALQERATH